MKTHTQGINCEVPQIQHKNKYLKYESVISKITNVNKVMLSSLYHFSPSSAEYHFEILKRHGATSPLPSPSLYFCQPWSSPRWTQLWSSSVSPSSPWKESQDLTSFQHMILPLSPSPPLEVNVSQRETSSS